VTDDDDDEEKYVDVDAKAYHGELISRRPILSRSPVLAILSTCLMTNDKQYHDVRFVITGLRR
jgi:hypothetical protein